MDSRTNLGFDETSPQLTFGVVLVRTRDTQGGNLLGQIDPNYGMDSGNPDCSETQSRVLRLLKVYLRGVCEFRL